MEINPITKTVGELALEMPNAINVLEKWKIDYCCHGSRSVAEACATAGVDVAQLLEEISPADTGAAPAEADTKLADLAQFIVRTHHTFTRDILDTVRLLSDKVAARHGGRHPEVLKVNEIVIAMCNDLGPHMLKEEQVLFPYIESMERALDAGMEPPTPFFGTVQRPIQMMMMEHETVGDLLVQLRGVTADYSLPPDACLSFRALYERLADLENDLHVHIHLENNLLFPRAAAMEGSVRPAAASFAGEGHGKCGCGCGH